MNKWEEALWMEAKHYFGGFFPLLFFDSFVF